MKPWLKKTLVLGTPLVVVGLLLLIPAIQSSLAEALSVLARFDLEPVKDYIRSFGLWAPLVSFLLMVLQSVVAPLPAFLLTFANAALWGWGWGALLSWSSAMAGAALCFALARWYGRGVVIKLTSRVALDSVDRFFAKHGAHSVLIARLLPFVSFDIVSYAAGLTPIRWLAFLVATGLGQLPATLVYSYAGQELTGGAQAFVTGLLIVFALVALGVLLRSLFREKNQSQE